MTTKIKTTTPGKTFTGIVVSDKMQRTIVVKMDYKFQHPLYKKIVKRTKKIYVDNNLNAKIGDTIKAREVKPISHLKRFTTLSIVGN
ncbi:30S ribosomal protein S17 [Candidatus Shapirobacteria bacterium CG_4_8_14_3_um_filter_35_11]|uniref:Small ribosomal subunit protein uS17 n=6 Tax=Candidatus Shapironibacteriota TaxID=1752721 RepID=A0A1J5I3I7_9BACT|nr:MAG: 30S ribosomal protein S17 [Candidatus Shapirobacteria bacterium CG2_30_35_20]PIV07749.1 MAG: 30S ribosomal protein S17 [Candidatus Shapirobacteria bacterium CG03_land_8_20_14_0_80_35_14]PIX68353.1 MAG: 30S ribosomal protein S17 [Candidatus Shapirobacteria bacterium CG_4_10_14_3_um_filter_35_13]PJA51307.1 MAG: 30S ribosomal protein S17 [Candidatus Shapirobacteria bacterium CG_4_9_14_3_um_filter_36_12]PJC80344.1 MAG: 30S ribosomal protein S17 [Candidatus Shapirobacteria bacterium CG_4_8_1